MTEVALFEGANRHIEIEPRFIPGFDYYDDKIVIRDPVWGDCEIGDQPGDDIFFELTHNDLVRRSMAIEQLTLDPLTATIPGTGNFSRWEHIWGSVAFVRKMTENMDLEPRERLILQLRTFVSDLGHTAYSHLGDWLFQGMGGSEDQHDDELGHLLEVSGINQTLRDHGIDPQEVTFPDTVDWVERPSPDLCVDRVDYGAREIQRWLNLSMETWFALKPEAFMVDNGNLVMKDQKVAYQFAKSFLLLSTEHWGEPVHRLQLGLQQELVKRVLGNDYAGLIVSWMDGVRAYHPRDLLYSIDADITREMHLRDDFLNTVRPLMEDIGQAKRRLFHYERKGQLDTFMRDRDGGYPDPLKAYSWHSEKRGVLPLLPSNIEVIPVSSKADVEDFGRNPLTVDFYLPSLKPRAIDPLFKDEKDVIRRLSEANPEFASLAEQQAIMSKRAYVARLLTNHEVKAVIESGMRENEETWTNSLGRKRMAATRFQQLLKDTVGYAAGHRMVDIGGTW